MSESPGRRDVDVVLHALLAVALIAGDGFVLLFLVPALFDRHDSALDIAAFVAVVGALGFSYLTARYLWRSAHFCMSEDE